MQSRSILPHEVVYRLYFENLGNSEVPVIETWRYLGYVKRECTSSKCDKPYWFYRFELVASDRSETIDIPSRTQLVDMVNLSELNEGLSSYLAGSE